MTQSPAQIHPLLQAGELHLQQDQPLLALRVLSDYVRLEAGDLQGWFLLAQAYRRLHWTFHAARCLETILERDPLNPSALAELAFYWTYLGQRKGLQSYFDRVLQLSPAGREWFASLPPALQSQYRQYRSNLLGQYLLYLYADASVSDRAFFAQVRRFRAQDKPLPPLPSRPLHALQNRPLRVAYLSREYGQTSSMNLLRPLMMHHSPAVEAYAYDDTVTASGMSNPCVELRPYFKAWRRITDLDHPAVARLLRADQIDILVDFGGLTHAHRQELYALHPCPVQISGLGFLFSSTYPGMDYCFSDTVLCPPEVAALYPETPLYLSSILHWQVPPIERSESEAEQLLPSERTGHLTLGSANTLNKLHPQVLLLWAQILRALPEAQLYLKALVFNDLSTQELYRQFFAALGLPSERLRLEGARPDQEHIAYYYAQLDLALDPFPYQGGLTTVEALWMGVPVVVLRRSEWASRALGASILTALDLPDWICHSEREYLQRTLNWAEDLDFRRRWRQDLRARVESSVLCDGRRFAREVETAYEATYATACGETKVDF